MPPHSLSPGKKIHMIKRINIYLTNDEKALVKEKMHHYHVSLSTMTQKCAFIFLKMINQKQINEEAANKILNEYINKNKSCYKTCCKPKDQELIKGFVKNLSIYYTNILKIYLNKQVKNYFTEEATKEIYEYINNELRECKETFYDYNNYCRNSARYFKSNPEYIKRKLAEMESAKTC